MNNSKESASEEAKLQAFLSSSTFEHIQNLLNNSNNVPYPIVPKATSASTTSSAPTTAPPTPNASTPKQPASEPKTKSLKNSSPAQKVKKTPKKTAKKSPSNSTKQAPAKKKVPNSKKVKANTTSKATKKRAKSAASKPSLSLSTTIKPTPKETTPSSPKGEAAKSYADFCTLLEADTFENWKKIASSLIQHPVFLTYLIQKNPKSSKEQSSSNILYRIILSRTIDQKTRTSLCSIILQHHPTLAKQKHLNSLPLHHVIRNQARMDSITKYAIMKSLIEAFPQALITADSTAGQTPLHVACCRGNAVKEIKLLLTDGGSDAAQIKDHNGNLPIHIALSRRCSPEKFKILVKAFPNCIYEKNDKEEIPLEMATRDERRDCFSNFLSVLVMKANEEKRRVLDNNFSPTDNEQRKENLVDLVNDNELEEDSDDYDETDENNQDDDDDDDDDDDETQSEKSNEDRKEPIETIHYPHSEPFLPSTSSATAATRLAILPAMYPLYLNLEAEHKRHDKEMKQLTQQHTKDVQDIAKKIETMRINIEAKQQEEARLFDQVKQLRETLKKNTTNEPTKLDINGVTQLEKDVASYQQQMANKKWEHDHLLRQLKTTHDKQIQNLELLTQDEILATNALHQSEKEKFNKSIRENIAAIRNKCVNQCLLYEEDIQKTLDKIKSLDQELTLLKRNHQVRSKVILDFNNEELSSLISQYEMKIAQEQRYLDDYAAYLMQKIKQKESLELTLNEAFECNNKIIMARNTTHSDGDFSGIFHQDVIAAKQMVNMLKVDRDRLLARIRELSGDVDVKDVILEVDEDDLHIDVSYMDF